MPLRYSRFWVAFVPKLLKPLVNYSECRLNAVMRLTVGGEPTGIAGAIEVLRVGYWFECLRRRLGERSAYAVGKRVQPDTYRKPSDAHDGYHHNLWARYATGRVIPGADTVRTTDALVPGSAAVLVLPFWDTLNVNRSIGAAGDQLLRQLRPAVQEAVFDRRSLDMGRYRRRSSLRHTLTMLESRADLESVAALVVLLREADEVGNRKRALQIGQSLYLTLLMACSCNPLADLQPELFEFLIRCVFPKANDGEVALDLDRDECCELGYRLGITILQLEDQDLINAVNGGSTRDWRKILRGKFGFDLQFAYAPRLKLAKPPSQVSESSREWVGAAGVSKEWGLAVLRAGRVEQLMPDEVIKAMAAAR